MDKLNDDIKKSFSQKFKNITDKLKQFNLNELLNKYNNKTNDLAESVNQTLISFLTKGKDKLFGVVDFLKELNNLKGNETLDKLLGLIDIIDDRLEDKNITANFTSLKDALESLDKLNDDIKKSFSQKFKNITDKLKQFNLNELLNKYNITQEKFKININISNERINEIEKSLNDYKNDFIDKLSNLNKSFPDLIKESMNNSQFLSSINEYLEGIKNKTMSLLPDKIQNLISNHSDFKIFPLKESFDALKEIIAESKPGKFIENLEESIYNCDIESIKDLLKIEKIENEVERIKGYFNQSNATFLVEKERESIRKIMNEIKGNISVFINNTKFAPVISKLKDINSHISDSFKKMEVYEDFKKFTTKVNTTNNALNTFFDKIQIFVLNSYFRFKENIPLKKSSQNNYLSKLGKELQEHLKKIKDIETNSGKISYIFNSTLSLNKDHQERRNKLLKSLKNKAEEANKTEIIKVIEKLNEMSTEANKNSEEKVKEFFNKIIDNLEKLENNYENAESLSEEKKEKLKKDLEELKSSNLTEQLNISYDQLSKDAEEYKEILQGIYDYFKNLPDDANRTEIFEQNKVIIVGEMKKIQQTVKDCFNDLDLEGDLNNLKEKILNSSLNDNLTEILDEYFLLFQYLKKLNITDLNKTFQKIFNKLSKNNSTQLQTFFEKMKSSDFFKGTSKIKEAINVLNKIKSDFNQTEISQDTKLLNEKIKELYECLIYIKNNSQFKEVIMEVISESEKLSLSSLIKILRGKKISRKDLLNLMKMQVLIDEIKEILSSSKVVKDTKELFNKKNDLRSLSVSSKKKKRRLDSTEQLTCKMDQTFLEDDELKPAENDLKLYFLCEENYELSISQSLKITVKKEEYNCNNNDYLGKMRSVYRMKSFSNFRVEKQKLRVRFTVHVKKMDQFTKPSSFFYIIVKFRFKSVVHNLRRLADENENNDAYCLLNDESNQEDNVFECFSYPDNLNEIEEPKGIQNITSEYITVPEDVPESNNGNSTEPDNNNYNNGINSFRNKKGSSLSGGAIAGIVIACVAAIAIVAGIMIYARSKSVQPAPIEASFNSVNALRNSQN